MQYVHNHHKLVLNIGQSSINALKLPNFTGACNYNKRQSAQYKLLAKKKTKKKQRMLKGEVHHLNKILSKIQNMDQQTATSIIQVAFAGSASP